MDIGTFDNVCRICLQRKDTLFSLFRKIKGSSPYDKILTKTELKITLYDSGPSSICSQCLIELDTTVNFLEKCENSNRILCTRLKIKEDCDSKTDAEVKNFALKRENEKLLFSGNVTNVLDNRYNSVKVSEKTSENVKNEFEEAFVNETPVVSETARCPQCGSLRRCRHRAPLATHTCQYCQKVFTRKFNFKLHLKRHLGERDWPCPTCGVRQLTRGLAQRHCEPRRRRACLMPGCEKSFTSNTNLTIHMRTHSGERPHVCIECGKSFTSKNTLNSHLRIHTGARPYICPVCGKRFATNKLSQHLRTHSGSRPHACAAAGCGRAFSSARALRLHAGTHAPAPAAKHACALCPRAYNHTQSLRKHQRQRHDQDPHPQD